MDLDNEELEATRSLEVKSIEEAIWRCKELIKPVHINWIGGMNQNAIKILLGNLEALSDMQDSANREIKELRKKVKELEEENEKLRIARVENIYGYENIYFITKNNLVSIDTNKYFIEIEEGTFVDLKQVYLDNKNSIPKQKVKDLKESVILDNIIVGGRRNAKTLEYGIKLGKIKACEELLEDKQ